MKLLSITIPCYNSQDYMEKAISSLLPGGEEVEILIVDDGSHDRTAEIADEYERRYPGIVRVIHQENGGHGNAVITGLRNATGLYFKVVDSDDWADSEAYPRILETLRAFTNEPIDMLVSNYIYDKVGVRHKHAVRYRHALPQVDAGEGGDLQGVQVPLRHGASPGLRCEPLPQRAQQHEDGAEPLSRHRRG